ncbi:MAG: uroporphyrinogen decarboxylase family protein [Desulfobacterales bacterium]|jgi:uroporphyrinogen decarboxylase
MNHKERILTALNHEEPDRVPVDLGGRQTTFMVETYNQIKAHLGLNDLPTHIMSHKWQTSYVDEQILNHFSIDCRHIRPPMKAEPELSETAEDKIAFVDEWGIKRIIDAGYASINDYPLQTATLEDLETYEWPDPAEIFDYSSMRSQALDLHNEGEYAIVGNMGSPGNIFEQSWYLRGMTEFFLDLVDNKDFAHALLSKITEIRKQNAKYFLKEVGEYLDVFQLADDLAMQNGPYMSPDLYREMIKPYQVELFRYVKELTPAKIYYHSCGSVTRLLDDLIDVGVEILNPVQVSADGMQTDQLKQRFGNKLSFWGAMDTIEILPNGTVDDVRKEVRKIIRDLAPGGGFVLASVHNLQPDIPPENIIAMFEAAAQYGNYPIL